MGVCGLGYGYGYGYSMDIIEDQEWNRLWHFFRSWIDSWVLECTWLRIVVNDVLCLTNHSMESADATVLHIRYNNIYWTCMESIWSGVGRYTVGSSLAIFHVWMVLKSVREQGVAFSDEEIRQLVIDVLNETYLQLFALYLMNASLCRTLYTAAW